jgi:hypothetical protein
MIRRLIEILFDIAMYFSIRKKFDYEDQIDRALQITRLSDDNFDRQN